MKTSMQRRIEVQENETLRYERMVEIREVEEQIFELFASGEVRGLRTYVRGRKLLLLG